MGKALNQFIQQPDFIVESCYSCAVEFGMPTRLYNELLKDRSRYFYCPNGHRQHYLGKSEAQQLRDQLAAKEAELERAKQRTEFAKNEAASERRSKEATKGHLTRLRKRYAAGVCPCCQRTFENVARHMKSQHPKWSEE